MFPRQHHLLVMVFMTIWSVEEYCLCPQGMAAARNMMVPVEARIDSDLLEDEYFNFSVRMYGSTSLSPRAGIQFAVPSNLRCVQFRSWEQKESGQWKVFPKHLLHLILLWKVSPLHVLTMSMTSHESVLLAICHGVLI